jgi:hypothetical protein
MIRFLDDLPHKLRVELSMLIHSKMYSSVNFFQKKDRSFLAWISTLLRPTSVEEGKYIYKEGEEITESKLIYFNRFSVFLGQGRMWLRSTEI